MDEADLQEILRRLQSGLREIGLGSIVAQGQGAVLEGRRIEVVEDDQSGAVRGRKFRAGDIRAEPLSTKEHVGLLLDLTEVAIGGTSSIEKRLARRVEEYLPGERSSAPVLTFAVDPKARSFADGIEGSDSDEPWSLRRLSDMERDVGRSEAISEALRIIGELRASVGVERRSELTSSSPAIISFPSLSTTDEWLE